MRRRRTCGPSRSARRGKRTSARSRTSASFATALTEKFGSDPLLSMLVFSESEGTALVHVKPAATAQFVIFQEGKWLATDGRELKPWAPDADPAVAQFRLSRVTDTFVRERFRAHRAQATRAADHLGPVKVGYFGKPFDRLILEYQVLGMTSFGLSAATFDLATGAPVDVECGDRERARPAHGSRAKG